MKIKFLFLKTSALLIILISMMIQESSFAQTSQKQTKQSSKSKTSSTQSAPPPQTTPPQTTPPHTTPPPQTEPFVEKKYERDRIAMRSVNPYNGWIWGGAGFLFESGSLIHYVQIPTMDYQVGVGKSIGNLTPDDFAYIALIFDFAHSRQTVATNTSASFYATNEQILLGYEQSFGTPYFSGFLEAGAVFQQRTFAVFQSSMADFIYATQWGGSFNGGFNIKIVPERRVSYLFRIGMNLMIGMARNVTLNYNGARVNVNPISYGPSLSFGVRM